MVSGYKLVSCLQIVQPHIINSRQVDQTSQYPIPQAMRRFRGVF